MPSTNVKELAQAVAVDEDINIGETVIWLHDFCCTKDSFKGIFGNSRAVLVDEVLSRVFGNGNGQLKIPPYCRASRNVDLWIFALDPVVAAYHFRLRFARDGRVTWFQICKAYGFEAFLYILEHPYVLIILQLYGVHPVSFQ